MHIAMLNLFPTWMLIGFLMIAFSLSATFFFITIRRYYPKLLSETMSPAFGVMGTSYGFLLGFTIAILWQNYTASSNVTAAEAANFNLIINDLQLLAPEAQLKLIAGIKSYINIIRDVEWSAMKRGESASNAWAALNSLYGILGTITPVGVLENIAYADIFDELSDVIRNRSIRIHHIDTILPAGIRTLLILGAIFIIYSVAVNDTKNKLNHYVAMLMVCFILSFNIGLAFILAFPFSSDMGVDGNILIKVIPNRLNNLENKLKGLSVTPL